MALQSVLDSVRSLIPDIAERALDVDQRGAVDRAVIALLHDCGYFSLLRPPGFGGPPADAQAYLTATREISAACVSTGWLAGWLAVNSWGLSVRDPRVLDEIWGDDARTLLCSSYAPTGRLERVGGGFRLSGRWARCTGAHHASWLSAAALLVGPDGAAQDFMAVLVPAADYAVESTWDGLGLRGIGADDVVVVDVFVPEYRAFSWLDLAYDARVAPLDRLPQPTFYTLAGTLPLLGAARRALDVAPTSSGGALSALAMADSDVALSVRQISRNVAEMVESVRTGEFPAAELALRNRRDQVMAAERAREAVRLIVQEAAYGDDDVLLERIWRDVQTACIHVSSNVEQVLSVVGRFELGLSVDDVIW
ncbi:acyl-CoA dehydrogenase family protein [Mycobacterium sp. SMC-4]|uniref:acyl-CoA dehydrogenase family protein n=1 Tax=Mycobacterium sp. SMC-4 TaxID=2857059 RepID=UPI0021B4C465|nr:acyl-CoA dehydrogenase family protein [Mycobacterium sp. SMC-4]